MQPTPEDLDALSRDMRAGEVSAQIDSLVTRLACLMLRRQSISMGTTTQSGVPYSPDGAYEVGQTVTYAGEDFEVVAIRRRRNPRQGTFSVVDLQAGGGSKMRVVADLSPSALASVRSIRSGRASAVRSSVQFSGSVLASDAAGVADNVEAVDAAQVAACVRMHGEALRAVLLADPRFADVPESAGAISLTSVSSSPHTLGASAPKGLFGEHVLAQHVEAQKPASEQSTQQLRVMLSALAPLIASAVDEGVTWSDRETWRRLVLPVLHLLGWSEVGPSIGNCYDLRIDAGSSVAHNTRRSCSVPMMVRPVGWGRDLADMAPKGADPSPGMDLVGRLIRCEGAWGILTNGRQWQLYRSSHGDTDIGSTVAETYALDLSPVLTSVTVDDPPRGDLDLHPAQRRDLLLWRDLFGSHGYTSTDFTPSLVERLKREATDYAWQATRRLQTQLLAPILPEIMSDFYAFQQQKRQAEGRAATITRASLTQIMQGALGLVARLLTVLFAENRGTLPMHDPDYRGQSLRTMQRWAMTQVRAERSLSRSIEQTPRYEALMALFRQIEHGSASMGLPSYSGGLFSPQDPAYGFLERHRLSDRVVAQTLAALGGVGADDAASADAASAGTASVDAEEIDYSAFSIRHLIAVCEGLMQGMAPYSVGGADDFSQRSDAVDAADRVLPSPHELVPDYIGHAAIERTLQQVLDERTEAFTAAMDTVVALRRQDAQSAADAAHRHAPDGDAGMVSERSAAMRAAEQAALRALLGLKVLDPSARAGGLLVAALDTLTDGVIGILTDYHTTHPNVPRAWNPVLREIQDSRTALSAEIAVPGIAPASLHLSDAATLARLIAERSLYGVDRHSLAAMLVQTSLQMRVFAVGAPFARLHSHLRRGDSLCGARLTEISDCVPAFADLRAEVMDAFTGVLSRDPTDHHIEEALRPYEMLLSIWLSEAYGNPGAQTMVHRRGHDLLAALEGERELEKAENEIVDRAQRIADERGFLHWEIAFPEVFLMPEDTVAALGSARSSAERVATSRSGFDVVLGRPPSRVELSSIRRSAQETDYAMFSSERRRPFTEAANHLVRQPGGRIAFLIASSEVGR